MARLHLKAGMKTAKKKDNDVLASATWVVGCLATIYLSWLLIVPGASGGVGLWLNEILRVNFGGVAFLTPIFLARLVWQGRKGMLTAVLASVIAMLAFSSLLRGGAVGQTLSAMLTNPFGPFGAGAVSLASALLSLQALFGIRWSKVASLTAELIARDYAEWQRARGELAAQLAKAVPAPAPVKPTAAPKPPERVEAPRPVEPPKNVNEPSRPAAKPVEIREDKKPVKPSESREVAPAPKDSPFANYKLPPIDLLNAPPPAENRGKPTEAEVQSAIAELERTLKSFEIDARVTGYAPGPVITRYEVSPAPGVKVSSIVQLENDIALAMKAKGIRIIAPIPGKAAVGIEIPNARPAMVVLRELLESGALPESAPLLSFGLGLSSSGAPTAADLQKMPHVLVAGATNSGKSVLIHSIITSILFRARPDEVKFLMIDPKRLELTFYDGIPHLFDPTQPAESVTVVTNPKDASKSLLALVKLMENRYQRFQLFGVRNIDSYNKEADKRGQPREYFIVVIIDELADLMLVAQDSVEDSIQRLTQMARAVGIHLVLATQRPSVDVITGVIKANLPARIALQVISKVDSKVILDTTGAEALQGKGDLLYLAAGSPKPERCQGAYVSEDEINKLAKYLRDQGKPEYPMLETMAKSGEAAADLASFGVEPLEFSQALKLILERRRVSQDLLKSQFGSSARATNILSALEVKQLINKPEGTNRWEIHFDVIEEYLRKNFPQVPLDRKP
jgi:S-DNA-T family DNA segregation ATPase FtsK/SpoIIIE